MRIFLASVVLAGFAVSASAQVLPACSDNGADHQRWTLKTQPAPSSLSVPKSRQMTVDKMLNWRVPVNIPSDKKGSDEPLVKREKDRLLYELTGFVRLVKLEPDCDFHVQVAQSRQSDAPQVVVEIPRASQNVQRDLMKVLTMKDGQKSKTWKADKAPQVKFVGFAFLDEPHQSNPPTQEGHGHGPPGVVQTLWELHPVLKVEKAGS